MPQSVDEVMSAEPTPNDCRIVPQTVNHDMAEELADVGQSMACISPPKAAPSYLLQFGV
jgi:hypothetical protein